MGDGADPDQDHRDFHRRWATLQPPLRPHANVVAAIAELLPPGDETVLLLGVTPELAVVPARTIGVDWSEKMVALAWPGDTPHRKGVLGDWRRLPLAEASVAAAIGDGCLTMLHYPDEQRLLIDQLRVVLARGGRLVLRCFATPEQGESLADVREAALSGTVGFHAFKQRFNMAAALEAGVMNIQSDRLFRMFEELFPDREHLSRASGWSVQAIAEIDAYRGSEYVHCYPSRSQLMALVPGWMAGARFVETLGYPLAERCPLLVLDFP
jgi:SAM-dependent methyltransferase